MCGGIFGCYYNLGGILAQAAITKYHGLHGLNNTFISHSSEGRKVQDQGASWFLQGQ